MHQGVYTQEDIGNAVDRNCQAIRLRLLTHKLLIEALELANVPRTDDRFAWTRPETAAEKNNSPQPPLPSVPQSARAHKGPSPAPAKPAGGTRKRASTTRASSGRISSSTSARASEASPVTSASAPPAPETADHVTPGQNTVAPVPRPFTRTSSRTPAASRSSGGIQNQQTVPKVLTDKEKEAQKVYAARLLFYQQELKERAEEAEQYESDRVTQSASQSASPEDSNSMRQDNKSGYFLLSNERGSQ